MSGDGELMMTILASFAQEESRSISENIKWRFHKSLSRGFLMRNSLYMDTDGKAMSWLFKERSGDCPEGFSGLLRWENKKIHSAGTG